MDFCLTGTNFPYNESQHFLLMDVMCQASDDAYYSTARQDICLMEIRNYLTQSRKEKGLKPFRKTLAALRLCVRSQSICLGYCMAGSVISLT